MLRALVLQAAGINCEIETARALALAGATPDFLHVNRLLEAPDSLYQGDLLVIPGGFSYGDDVAAGRILGDQLARRLGDHLRDFVAAGKPIAGICNGFQVLSESGLLDDEHGKAFALTRNAGAAAGRYVCRWATLKKIASHCVWTHDWRDDEPVEIPLAHAEGRVVFRDDAARSAMSDRVAAAYVDAAGLPDDLPGTPNGSTDNIAGMCDATGLVVGLMPHPERYVEAMQHPAAARRRIDGLDTEEPPGLRFFQAGVRHASGL